MKTKQLILLGLTFLAMNGLFAQGIYFGLGGGYGFSAGKISDATYSSTTTASSYSTTVKNNAYSFGQGISAGGYFGYEINNNFAIELGGSYLIGSKHTSKSESISSFGSTNSYTSELTGRMIRLVPSLRMSFGEKSLKPYIKTGLILGVGGKVFVKDEETYVSSWSNSITKMEYEYYGGISLGFYTAVGLNYFVTDKLGIFLEFAGNAQSWAMTNGKLTSYTEDGVDMLPSLTVSDKEVEFVNEYTNSTGTTSSANPTKQIKQYLSFSSVGLNIGIHFSLK